MAERKTGAPGIAFKNETIKEILECSWQNTNTKSRPDSLLLTGELMRRFVLEAIRRADLVAQADVTGDNEVCVDSLEKIVPQLLLDFA